LVYAHCATHLTTHPVEALWNKTGGLGSRSGENKDDYCLERIYL
jgi:hypothetical protein